jgi:transglutaminase-like putative cysteine protease
LNAISSSKQTAKEDAISLPLYVSGLIVSIIGILVVNSTLANSDTGTTTIALTVLGFLFSIGCRWLKIKQRVIELLGGCVIGFILCQVLLNNLSRDVFIPPDITEGDIIMAIVLQWLTVVRSWVLLTDNSVAFTAVTSIAMIGLVGSSNINSELMTYFFIYVVVATFMLLHQTYLTQRSWFLRRSSEKSEANVIGLQASIALCVGIATVLVGMVVVIPVEAVGAHLSLGSALKGFVRPQTGSDIGVSSNHTTYAIDDGTTFNVGQGTDSSSASTVIVLHVYPSDQSEHYYQGRTYDYYDGNGWKSTSSQRTPLEQDIPTPNESMVDIYDVAIGNTPGDDVGETPLNKHVKVDHLVTTFTVESSYTSTLYTPYGTDKVVIPDNRIGIVYQSSDDALSLSNAIGQGYRYRTFSDFPDATNNELNANPDDSRDCPPNIKSMYVDQKGTGIVSPSDQVRLATTAQQIVDSLPQGRRTDFDIALAIRAWVSHRCVYSLNVDSIPAGHDAVSYFLFNSRKGYCDMFASSMAILCRYAGLPTRVATGFDPGVATGRGSYDLEAKDKHAWVEVWFAGYGWQTFDPTIGAVVDNSTDPLAEFNRWLRSKLTAVRLFIELYGSLPFVLGFCVVAGLLYIVKVEIYDKRFGRARLRTSKQTYRTFSEARKVSSEAAAAFSKNAARERYRVLEAIFREAHLVRTADQTPDEFFAIIRARLALAGVDTEFSTHVPQLTKCVRTITDDVMLASYAPIELVGATLIANEETGEGRAAIHTVQKLAKVIVKIFKKSIKEAAPS